MDEPTKSLYPGFIPPEEGHPTSAQFEVVGALDEKGRFMRSKAWFRKGENVARLSGILTRQTTLDTIQISDTLHFHDPWFCRFLLHSCDPNIAIDTEFWEARAAREIHPGDSLAYDYATTEDMLSGQFACCCGSRDCRGWIMGRREKPNVEGCAFLAQREIDKEKE